MSKFGYTDNKERADILITRQIGSEDVYKRQIPERDILECIRHGIAKINVNTEISVYAVDQTKLYLESAAPHFSELSLRQVGYVKEIVKKYISFFRE